MVCLVLVIIIERELTAKPPTQIPKSQIIFNFKPKLKNNYRLFEIWKLEFEIELRKL